MKINRIKVDNKKRRDIRRRNDGAYLESARPHIPGERDLVCERAREINSKCRHVYIHTGFCFQDQIK